jgi:class 3 adenylate cyclase
LGAGLWPQAKTGGLSHEEIVRLQLVTSDASSKQGAILVTDDSPEVRRVIVFNLTNLGYRNITEAEDGQAALELLQQREFDLLILDIEMPRRNGYQVLAAVKEDPRLRHVPVIVVSGLDQIESIVRCIELGAEDFLAKPFNSVLLGARVRASLERKRLRDLDRLRLLELQQEKLLLEIEQDKSERLLLNILPPSIAEQLKRGENTIARRYASVTVLFADLMDFSLLANRMDPGEVVDLLNDLFSRFDRLADHFGLEKIKTIGDSYLVVGGLPELRPNHTEAVADMALAMLTALADLNRKRGTTLELRLGLNTGPVVAGVIGHKKFTYDLWGAAVNLAARMQSSGVANRVHLTAETCELLRGKYHFTERGTVFCKGLGDIHTCLLDGKIELGAGS